ncbi:hypothetical protein C2845_PM17G00870 [Panicum miliaceum]|uniref:RING-type domain-containing protein n=1 Tax=Panicum miliaceum TaxID=4540 RepID=A0A3L6Q5W6_PANMI|nr:hypothetical protein C2845_PM17G00870 [Panicum miliaceum]
MDAFLLALFVIAAVLVITCLCSKNNHHQDQQQADARLPEEMKAIAIALLDSVTYPRRNASAAGGDDPSSAEETAAVLVEDCAICLGPFEDGDLCSIMPVCRHEFHRDCIVDWLMMACKNTCPLRRAQLQWSVAAENMVKTCLIRHPSVKSPVPGFQKARKVNFLVVDDFMMSQGLAVW